MTRNFKRWAGAAAKQPALAELSDLSPSLAHWLPVSGGVLDLTCGAASNAFFLAERGLRVVATDGSKEAFRQGRELARQRRVEIDWIRAG